MSQLRKWVEDAMKPKIEGVALNARVAVRMTTAEEQKLKAVAEMLNLTKTGAAEQMLRAAICDSFALLLESLDEDEAAGLVHVVEADTEQALHEEELEFAAEQAAAGRGAVETAWEVTK